MSIPIAVASAFLIVAIIIGASSLRFSSKERQWCREAGYNYERLDRIIAMTWAIITCASIALAVLLYILATIVR